MKYDQLIIYYFSGTGNARNAAIWIEDVAREKGLSTHLINIDRLKKIDISGLTEKTLIGFCFPTHGFNLPPLMLRFIARFPKKGNFDFFLLNTRGGVKLNRLFILGLSGVAQLLPAIILWFKGYRIVGMQPLDQPSNWIFLHPGLKPKVIHSIYKRCYGIVNNFAEKILNGKKSYKALWSLPIDLALFPISMGYYFIGRFFLAKTLIATSDCDSCEACIIKCPAEAIKMVDKRPFWTYKCESCMRCINICPKRAIETAHGFSGLMVVVVYALLVPLIVYYLRDYKVMQWVWESALFRQLWSVAVALVFILVLFIGYRILHFLLKYRFVERIISYSSLSRYKFWRRYKAPKNYINMGKH